MLTFRAQPSRAISSPAKGSTGQKPCSAISPDTVKETAHRLPKKITAPLGVSEQRGESSMRVGVSDIGSSQAERGLMCVILNWQAFPTQLKDLRH